MYDRYIQQLPIVLVGAPKTGKTTLAKRLAHLLELPVIHSDEFLGMPHRTIPHALAKALRRAPRSILEGTHAIRCLSRGLFTPGLVVWCRGPSENAYPTLAWVVERCWNYQQKHPGLVVERKR